MNSVSEIKPKSDLPAFSDFPGFHYILTICIVLLVCDLYWSGRTYYCLSSGNDYECHYDVIRLQALGQVSVSQTFLILNSLLLTLLHNLVQLPLVLITFAPGYLIATYISRRCHIRRNLVGVIFWIVAWTLAALPLPLAHAIFGHVSWRTDIVSILMFGGAGASCGVVYCLLAFRGRVEALTS
jgi:hypothetical protein